MRDLYGKQILLPACPDEHISLIRALQEQEAAVDVVEAYHLLPPDPNNSSTLQILLSGELDGVVFFHPAEIRALANMLVGRTNASLREILVNLKVTCATVATAETARALGVRVDDLPETDTVDGVCAGLEQIYLVKGKMES
jgi:uroporphyrinogen-III synthase